MVRAVEDAAFGVGYRLLLCNSDERRDKQRAYLEMLASERVSGVILSPTTRRARRSASYSTWGSRWWHSTATSTTRAPTRWCPTARTRRAAEHLLGAGHERIALIAGPSNVETSAFRGAGYEAAMQARGLSPVIGDGRFRIAGGREATAALLAEHADVTGLVVANNLMAIGTLKALAAAGRRVPADIAVVALDDPFWAELVQPPLTVLAQPVRPMAEAAVRLLLERVTRRREAPQQEVFKFELRVRGSCGTAPADNETR